MSETFKVIVAGTRTFSDYDLLKSTLDKLLQNKTDIEIVSGKARGADALGEQYAKERGYKLTVFPADWEKYGKSAGFRRNAQMADYANACVVFWDGISKGSKMMAELAQAKGLQLRIIRY